MGKLLNMADIGGLSLEYFLNQTLCFSLPSSKTGAHLTSYLCQNLCVDWLQVYLGGVVSSNAVFRFDKLDFSTNQFKCVHNVYFNSSLIGSCCSVPLSQILPPDAIIFKFDNQFLYNYDSLQFVNVLCSVCGWGFRNLTRIDVACDFNSFAYGCNPENLIHSFLNGKLKRIGSSKFRLAGECGERVVCDYLRFGSNSSDFSVYLYNKTKEMAQVKTKPWIIDKWRRLGINTDIDVWRLEVSMKSAVVNHICRDSGEVNRINLSWLQSYENLSRLYYCSINKYFGFVYNSGKCRKDREKKVILFDNIDDSGIIKRVVNSLKSNRSNKIFIKHMELYNDSMRGFGIKESLERDKVLLDYCAIHGLEDYYFKKVKGVKNKIVV